MTEIGLKRTKALYADSRNLKPVVKSSDTTTIACIKHGSKYSAEYVNRLASMVKRWSPKHIDFVCFTEDTRGIEPKITTLPLPKVNSFGQEVSGYWNKLSLFRDKIDGVGSHILYLDLDVIITGDIEPLIFYDSEFALATNFYAPSFSSSVMRFKVGIRPDIWGDFNKIDAFKFPGDEDWISIKVPDADVFSRGVVLNLSLTCC